MANKKPWMQFYVADWMTDTALTKCALATRGVWIELLCVMHKDGETGSVSGTVEQLSNMARCSAAEMTSAIDDLERTGAADVTKRNGYVTLINRRMKQEFDSRNSNKIRVAKHRNAKVTPEVTPNVTPCNGIESESYTKSDTETEEKKKEFCAEVQKTAPTAPAPEQDEIVMEFLVAGNQGKPWGLRKVDAEAFVSTYPGVNVQQELKEIRTWCLCNPRQRKTPGGMLKFLNWWLSREQDKAGKPDYRSRAAPAPAASLMPEQQTQMRKFGDPQ